MSKLRTDSMAFELQPQQLGHDSMQARPQPLADLFLPTSPPAAPSQALFVPMSKLRTDSMAFELQPQQLGHDSMQPGAQYQWDMLPLLTGPGSARLAAKQAQLVGTASEAAAVERLIAVLDFLYPPSELVVQGVSSCAVSIDITNNK